MSNQYSQSPELQSYLNLVKSIEYSSTQDPANSMGHAWLAETSGTLLADVLTEGLTSKLKLSTMKGFAAGYVFAFGIEFIGEMIERSGNGSTPNPYGGDTGLQINSNFGDKWYHNVAESFVDSAFNILIGLNDTITDIFNGDFNAVFGPTNYISPELVLSIFSGQGQELRYESAVPNYPGYTYTFRGSRNNDNLDYNARKFGGTNLPYDTIVVYGGDGRDLIANVDKAYGESGNDQIESVSEAWGGSGRDYIKNAKTAHGESDRDYITGAETAYGGAHNDFIENTKRTAHGEHGNDVLINNNISRGGDGNDYIVGSDTNYSFPILKNNILDGGNGNDYLEGKSQADHLLGGAGDDILIGGDGNDRIDGGADSDVAIFRGDRNFRVLKVSELSRAEQRLINGWRGNWEYQIRGQGWDKVKNIESVTIQGGKSANTIDASRLALPSMLDGLEGNDVIKGGSNIDIIVGGLGDDDLQGNDNDDVLIGGSGNDILNGGSGNDILQGDRDRAISFKPAIWAHRNFGAGTGWGAGFNVYPRQVADVNGDGRADIVGFANHGVVVALGQNNGTFGTAQFAYPGFGAGNGWGAGFDVYPRQVADVNGDGRADIVGFANHGVVVALGQSNGTFGTAQFAYPGFGAGNGWGAGFNRYPRQLADVNGDGRADIVGFAGVGVVVAMGQRNGTFGTAKIANRDFADRGGWGAGFDRYPRQVADVNGDGRADIVGFGEGAVFVALGQRNGTFDAAKVAYDKGFTAGKGWGAGFNTYPRQVADVDGDGRADMVGFAEKGVYVARGKSDGTFSDDTFVFEGFTNGTGWGAGFNTYPRQMADVNGDGKADIIGFAHAGVVVALSKEDPLTGGSADRFVFNGNDGVDTIRDFNRRQGDVIQIDKSAYSLGARALTDGSIAFNADTGRLSVNGNAIAILEVPVNFAVDNGSISLVA